MHIGKFDASESNQHRKDQQHEKVKKSFDRQDEILQLLKDRKIDRQEFVRLLNEESSDFHSIM